MGSLSNLFSEFDIRASRLSAYLFAEPQSYKDWGSQALFLESALSSRWFVLGRRTTSKVLYHVFGNTLDSTVVRGVLQDASVLKLIFQGICPSTLMKNPVAMLIKDSPERVSLGYVDYVLGLNEHFVDAYGNFMRLEYTPGALSVEDFWKVASGNPYKLSLLDCRFTLEELDSLAQFFGYSLLDLPDDLRNMRFAAIMHIRMLEQNGLSAQSSIIPYSEFISSGFPLFAVSNTTFETIRTSSLWYPLDTCSLVSELFDVPSSNFEASSLFALSWVSTKQGMRVFDYSSNLALLQIYRASNLGYTGAVDVNAQVPSFVGDLFNLYRESWLARWFERVNQESVSRYSLSDFECARFLKWFEERVGFSLEEEQKSVLGMLKYPAFVISGVAGSGKTTVASLLYRYLRECGLEQSDIAFCAPTGKAAARIREVVGVPAYTLHSYFRLASDGTSTLPLTPLYKPRVKVLIIDECSMINLSVFYEVVRSLPEAVQLILIGDEHQLPPIGVGCFFSDIQHFIPSAHLSVSKRVSDNSGLIRTSSRVLEYPVDSYLRQVTSEVLRDEEDVRVVPLQVSEVHSWLFSLVQNHVNLRHELSPNPEWQLSGLAWQDVGSGFISKDLRVEPSDFQVITPFRKYVYGADSLNLLLQDLLNPVDGLESKRKTSRSVTQSVVTKFSDGGFRRIRIGDRVIHTTNLPRQTRYTQHGSLFSKLPVYGGVMNGDVGYVSGIYQFKHMHFDGVKPLSIDADALVLVVDYTDVDTAGKPYTYSIFYPLSISKKSYRSSGVNALDALNTLLTEVEVNYGGLVNLELAYALTVHKMQGSQAKLVAFVLFPSAAGNSDFISRNLVYTGITRASDGLYVAGDVASGSYVVPMALQLDALGARYTLLGCMSGLKKV